NMYLTSVTAELAAGDLRAGQRAADEALRLAPTSAGPYVALSQVALRARDFDTALAARERALAISPTSAAALNNRGVALRDLGRLRDATRAYAEASRLEPSGRVAPRNLAHSGAVITRLAIFCGLLPLLALPDGPLIFLGTLLAAGVLITRRPSLQRRLHEWDVRIALR